MSGAPSHRPARAVRPHLFSPLLCLFVCWKSAGRGCELFLFLCGKGRDCWDFKVVCRGRVLGGLRGMRRGIFLFLFFFISPATAAARRLNIQRFCSCGERTRRSSEKLHEPPCLSLVVRVYIFDFHFFPRGPATYGHLFLLWHSVCVCVCFENEKLASASYFQSLLAGGNGAGTYKQRGDPTPGSQEGC